MEPGAEAAGVVLHIVVVGFHHKKGCQVEFSYPPLVPEEGHDGHSLPEEWKYLPFLALPDGAHNYLEDTVYFHLPPRSGNRKTVYGVSCYRQIEAKNSRSSRTGENKEHKDRKRKRTAMTAIVIKIFILNVWLRGNADPITSNPPAINVSLPRSTKGPVTSHAALSWCAKFITWYSLSYLIEALLALAILCCAVQTMRLRKWRRRAYRARTPVYRIQSPMFGYDQTPDPRNL